ncbi:hypothetical protein Tsubulata_037593 [Turnera subulata]|uniref:Uncharacterized protein n=1 Tax=Turnera subulata TaxID=218843 RepID=A0A9Q0F9N7_9ROSI|nr:hypothetical protein Tsubulata_037593 [Turnera subulata]
MNCLESVGWIGWHNGSIAMRSLLRSFIAPSNTLLRVKMRTPISAPFMSALTKDYDDQKAWEELIGSDASYDSTNSSSTNIRDPFFRYMQYVLSHSINYRESNRNVVSKDELFRLWCMKNHRPINTSCFLLWRLVYHSKRPGAFGGASFVTFLAKKLGVDVRAYARISGKEVADLVETQ